MNNFQVGKLNEIKSVITFRITITIRDIIAVSQLVIAALSRSNSPSSSIYHAFSATFFDAFGTLSARFSLDCDTLKKKAINGVKILFFCKINFSFFQILQKKVLEIAISK